MDGSFLLIRDSEVQCRERHTASSPKAGTASQSPKQRGTVTAEERGTGRGEGAESHDVRRREIHSKAGAAFPVGEGAGFPAHKAEKGDTDTGREQTETQ